MRSVVKLSLAGTMRSMPLGRWMLGKVGTSMWEMVPMLVST